MEYLQIVKEIYESKDNLILIKFATDTQAYEAEYEIANLCHIYKGSSYEISKGRFQKTSITD
jgi:hypothetical protein